MHTGVGCKQFFFFFLQDFFVVSLMYKRKAPSLKGCFAIDPNPRSTTADLEDELRYWTREQLDAFHDAMKLGLRRLPWAVAKRVPGKNGLECGRLIRMLDEHPLIVKRGARSLMEIFLY